MNPVRPAHLVTALATLAIATACNQSKASPSPEPPKPAGTVAEPATGGADRLDTSSLASPLATYESLRAMLADDRASGLAEAAERLSKEAANASKKVPSALASHVEALSRAAGELAQKPASNMDDVRRAFGEVSRHVVAILVAEPGLRSGKHVFECPMAQGYKKWVQTAAKISNPYMGKKMLECGSESEWK